MHVFFTKQNNICVRILQGPKGDFGFPGPKGNMGVGFQGSKGEVVSKNLWIPFLYHL